jgi:hypothetical protein
MQIQSGRTVPLKHMFFQDSSLSEHVLSCDLHPGHRVSFDTKVPDKSLNTLGVGWFCVCINSVVPTPMTPMEKKLCLQYSAQRLGVIARAGKSYQENQRDNSFWKPCVLY